MRVIVRFIAVLAAVCVLTSAALACDLRVEIEDVGDGFGRLLYITHRLITDVGYPIEFVITGVECDDPVAPGRQNGFPPIPGNSKFAGVHNNENGVTRAAWAFTEIIPVDTVVMVQYFEGDVNAVYVFTEPCCLPGPFVWYDESPLPEVTPPPPEVTPPPPPETSPPVKVDTSPPETESAVEVPVPVPAKTGVVVAIIPAVLAVGVAVVVRKRKLKLKS